VLISPTRPRSILAASGSLPTQVVGFLVLSIILLFSTTRSHQQTSGRWRGAHPPSVHGSTSSGRRATGDGRRTKDYYYYDYYYYYCYYYYYYFYYYYFFFFFLLGRLCS
jgi:hypothetical protein